MPTIILCLDSDATAGAVANEYMSLMVHRKIPHSGQSIMPRKLGSLCMRIDNDDNLSCEYALSFHHRATAHPSDVVLPGPSDLPCFAQEPLELVQTQLLSACKMFQA